MTVAKVISRRVIDPAAFEALHDVSPVLRRIYAARSVRSQAALDLTLTSLHAYDKLMGIDIAAEQLATAVMNQQKILILGDFDADGATSTALAVKGLCLLGAMFVDYLVPNRFLYGYGITPELVEVAAKMKPDWIVTVDNGISNHAGVSAAKALGIRVLITDHHLPADTLPEADAIVNPNQQGDLFPSKALAGVGVMFYVLLALRRVLSQKGWFEQRGISEPNLAQLLDFVALGTVADLVPLDQNNRILVHHGLKRIRAGQCSEGMKALFDVSKRDIRQAVSSDLGFAIGARLNAAGRMDDMSLGVACLLADNRDAARELADRLNQLNLERRDVEQSMQLHAETLLSAEKDASLLQTPYAIALYNESWHQGVIGILASRVKDKHHRPVIIFAPGLPGEMKGSARSIPGFHIRDALQALNTQHPDLILKFGGHAMAAGLTIKIDQFKRFSALMNDYAKTHLTSAQLERVIETDGELSVAEMGLDLALLVRESNPWGQCFPEPLFDGIFEIMEQRIVGERHLKLTLKRENKLFQAIAFFVNTNEWPNHRCRFVRTVYRLDVNEYQDRCQLQLMIDELQVAD